MHKKQKRLIAYLVLIVMVAVVFSTAVVWADDTGQQGENENKVVGFFKKLFLWPVNIVKRGGEGVVNTGKEVAEGAGKTGESIGKTIGGDLKEAPGVVIEPIKGTVKTGVKAVEETVKTPIEGTTETWGE